MAKKLYRSRRNSVIGGVCGGLGEYFDIDPIILRILAVLLIFADGIGILAYVVAWIIIPQRKEEIEEVEPSVEKTTPNQVLLGAIFIVVGAIFLLNNLVGWFHFKYLWPLILVAIGIAILVKSQKREERE